MRNFIAILCFQICLTATINAQENKALSVAERFSKSDLNSVVFRNGDSLTLAQAETEWLYAFQNYIPAYCYPVNDFGFIDSNRVLYNIHALKDVRGLAPKGSRIPTIGDAYELISLYGSTTPVPFELDTDSIYNVLDELKHSMASTDDIIAFIEEHSDNGEYMDDVIFVFNYLSDVQSEVPLNSGLRDYQWSTVKENQIIGPFLHDDYLSIAKVIGFQEVTIVSARHILLVVDEANPSAKVHKQADKLIKQIRRKKNFEEMVRLYSADPGSIETGGAYYNFTEGVMVEPFNDFSFQEPIGKIGKIETVFGVHIMEVLERKEICIPQLALVKKGVVDYRSAATYIKSDSGWMFDLNGNNESGLSFYPVAFRTEDGDFMEDGLFSGHWLADQVDGEPYVLVVSYSDIIAPIPVEEGMGFLIRVVREE